MSETRPGRGTMKMEQERFAKSDDGTSFPGRRASRAKKRGLCERRQAPAGR
jgi:hypothetical protein